MALLSSSLHLSSSRLWTSAGSALALYKSGLKFTVNSLDFSGFCKFNSSVQESAGISRLERTEWLTRRVSSKINYRLLETNKNILRSQIVISLFQHFVFLPVGIVLFEFRSESWIDEKRFTFGHRYRGIRDQTSHPRLSNQRMQLLILFRTETSDVRGENRPVFTQVLPKNENILRRNVWRSTGGWPRVFLRCVEYEQHDDRACTNCKLPRVRIVSAHLLRDRRCTLLRTRGELGEESHRDDLLWSLCLRPFRWLEGRRRLSEILTNLSSYFSSNPRVVSNGTDVWATSTHCSESVERTRDFCWTSTKTERIGVIGKVVSTGLLIHF